MDATTMMAIMIKTKGLYNVGYGHHLEDDDDNEDCDGCDVDVRRSMTMLTMLAIILTRMNTMILTLTIIVLLMRWMIALC